MNTIFCKTFSVLATATLLASPTAAFAADANLKSDDYVGISFWLISMALVAATGVFLY